MAQLTVEQYKADRLKDGVSEARAQALADKYKSNLDSKATPTTTGSYSSTLPNTLATNATKSASEITQAAIGNAVLNGTSTATQEATTTTQDTGTTQVKGTTYKGQMDAANAAAAANNASVSPPTNPMDAIMSAYTNALRVGSAQSQTNQQQALAYTLQANQIAMANNKATQDLLAQSNAQQAASNQILQNTLSSLNSGSKGAQTGMEAEDVSAQMAQQGAKRRDLRKSSTADTKQAGLLSQKALLSKPTLLGL